MFYIQSYCAWTKKKRSHLPKCCWVSPGVSSSLNLQAAPFSVWLPASASWSFVSFRQVQEARVDPAAGDRSGQSGGWHGAVLSASERSRQVVNPQKPTSVLSRFSSPPGFATTKTPPPRAEDSEMQRRKAPPSRCCRLTGWGRGVLQNWAACDEHANVDRDRKLLDGFRQWGQVQQTHTLL